MFCPDVQKLSLFPNKENQLGSDILKLMILSRTVSDLQKNGILAREPGAIIIKKPDVLRKRIR